jgi:hypothetical protein
MLPIGTLISKKWNLQQKTSQNNKDIKVTSSLFLVVTSFKSQHYNLIQH